jgi:hypothetical protein
VQAAARPGGPEKRAAAGHRLPALLHGDYPLQPENLTPTAPCFAGQRDNDRVATLLPLVQVIRHPRDGTLTSLDFGPVGGRDIAFTPARESLWVWGRKRLARARPVPKGTPGEVREMPVGRQAMQGLAVAALCLNFGIFKAGISEASQDAF